MTIQASIKWTYDQDFGEWGWQSQDDFNTTVSMKTLTHDILEHNASLLTKYHLNGEQYETTATGAALETRANWGIGEVTPDGLVNDLCELIASFAYDDEPLDSGLEIFSYVDVPACDDDQITEIVKLAINKYPEIFDGSEKALEIEDRMCRLMYLGSQTILDMSEDCGTQTYDMFQSIEEGLTIGIADVLARIGYDTDYLWDGFTLDIVISNDFWDVTVTPDSATEMKIVNEIEVNYEDDEDEY